jgi:GntR family transcriptional regulator
MVNPAGAEPLHLQLAAYLRHQITSGELGPGAALPSISQLVSEHGVSSTAVRQALGVLRDEGLTIGHAGRGTYVRIPPAVRRVSSSRYAAQLAALARGEVPAESAFARDYGVDQSQVTVECHFAQVPASETVAAALGVEIRQPVFERRMTMNAAGRAEQIRRAWYPLELVDGTPMTDPSRQPVPGGVIAELAALGIELTATDEDVRARMPTPDESTTLRLHGGTPVLELWRVAHSKTGPVEAVSIVLPADRVVLHYRTEF